jgi:hypothetical protein
MISVIKHVADQQPQRRLVPPDRRIDRHRTSRWSHMRFPEANTTGTAGAGSYTALSAGPQPTHAFICYKHGDARAKGVLAHVSVALSQAHRRFFAPAEESAQLDWAAQLAREIKRSNVAVAVLANQPIAGEIVEAELAQTRHMATPQIFILRHSPSDGSYPLSHALDQVDDLIISDDVHELAAELRRAFASTAAATRPRHDKPATPTALSAERTPPLPWANPEPPARDTEPHSTFYIERPADSAALQAIRGQGVTLAITGARQVGKTALLAHTSAEACRQGKCVLTLDFQLFERDVLSDPDRLFRYICEAASVGLGIESRVDAFWGSLGNSYNCTRYFEQYLLPQLNAPLVLALDKLERIPDTALRASFFSMLRAWCDNRAVSPVWRQLDLVLVTSSAADQLIANSNQSPFNTALTVALDDFTADQIADLNERYGRPFAPPERQALAALLAGHPYLIRQALHLAASGAQTPAQIIDTAASDAGPFGDHLRYQLLKLCDQPRLATELQQIISCGISADEWAFNELRSAGLVRRDGDRAIARCRLYAVYFQQHLG